MTPRAATLNDVGMLARLHAQAWQESYPGLLPASEIAAHGFEKRVQVWTWIITQGIGRVMLIDDLGFAHFGPQREDVFRDQGYVEELFSMYLIRAGYGLGRDLLVAAFGPAGRPFTACVIKGNSRASAFYEKSGGSLLLTRAEKVGETTITDCVYGWTKPPFT